MAESRNFGQVTQVLQFTFFGAVLMYLGRPVLIPLSFAVLISFVLYPVCRWLEGKRVGRIPAVLLAIGALFLLSLLILGLLIYQMTAFMNEWPTLQAKINISLEQLSAFITSAWGLSHSEQQALVQRITSANISGLFDVLRSAVRTSLSSMVFLVIVPVYAFLILTYRGYWMALLQRFFPSEGKASLRNLIRMTITTYYNFIKGMVFVYLCVAVLNSIGLLILGVPHAILFGCTASILTFIPYVGIVAGSLLPIAVSWIEYGSIWYPIGVIGLFAFVQYLEANVIFPFAVSSRLGVNALVMLLAIFTGGLIWGVSGMILFVPFVGIARVIADHHPKLKTIAMALGPGDKQN